MKRGLVVLQETDLTDELLDEAGTYANAAGAELLLLSFISEAEYENDVGALASIGDIENTSYNDDAVLGGVEQDIEEVATATFDGRLVDYESIVKVAEDDEHAERALEVAVKHECDHIFVVGKKRSPTGKAIFGDTVQRLILNFDGFVTVSMK